MNSFLDELINNTNYTYTENGAVTHITTKNPVLDMFAMGGAFRNRLEKDCINLFAEAFQEDRELALKCLFYLGDCRGGQGERRFFRVCFRWLANNYPEIAKYNLENIPAFRRWDDILYSCVDTQIENAALSLIKEQLIDDLDEKYPSLLAKWLPSENSSSRTTKKMASKVREFLGMTHKEYRKTLSILRNRIKVTERLMSDKRWDEIEFDKIPSLAGMRYSSTFMWKDETQARYLEFIQNKNTKVNASVLYPYDIAHEVFKRNNIDDAKRTALQKYWDNLPNYYGDIEENAIAVVDVSGSMYGTPIEAAVSLGAYVAEKGHGPFANHFITFSAEPKLVKFTGKDIVEKFQNCSEADWGFNTNIEAVFNLLLTTAKSQNTKPEDMPDRLYVFSDMEFDSAFCHCHIENSYGVMETLFEHIAKEWAAAGYKLPQVVFWNLDARQNNIPGIGNRFSYVSGFSPIIMEQVLSHKTGEEIMLDKLNSERYSTVTTII